MLVMTDAMVLRGRCDRTQKRPRSGGKRARYVLRGVQLCPVAGPFSQPRPPNDNGAGPFWLDRVAAVRGLPA